MALPRRRAPQVRTAWELAVALLMLWAMCGAAGVERTPPPSHSFAPLQCSYAIAISYVLFDTYDKWQKTLGDARAKLGSRPGIPASVDLER